MESATSSRPPASPPVWLTVFASLTGNLFLVVGTTILSVLSILVSWIPPRGNAVFLVGRLWARALLAASCLRVDVIREAELDPRGSYVFLSNHQSLFDIPVLFATVPGQTRMMAKRSLFRIPVFGWAIATGGFIPIDRGDRSTARHSFAAAIGKLRRGTSVLLFPEGTRALADTLLPFQRGGFLLALKSGLPIVPVGVRGTRAVQSKKSFAIRPCRIEVRYGAPIEVTDYGVKRKKELVAEVRARIAALAGLELDPATDVAEA